MMKRTLESWSAVCVAESTAVAWSSAQSHITEVLRWTSATVDEARAWASVANKSANAYAARLVSAAAATKFGLNRPYSG